MNVRQKPRLGACARPGFLHALMTRAKPVKGTAMPKVNLYGRPNPNGRDADRRIELGWSPQSMGGGVQLGVTYLEPEAEQYRVREYMPAQDPTAPYVPAWKGQFIDLDRDLINDLIRALRECRDKSYGRDE